MSAVMRWCQSIEIARNMEINCIIYVSREVEVADESRSISSSHK